MSCLVSNSNSLFNLVEKVWHSFSNKANPEKLQFTNHIPADISNINGNSDVVMFTLVNLIDNAIKSVSQYGLIEIGAESNRNEIIIWVKDSGIGIPQELHRKIFERKNGHNGYSGKGVGLSAAKRIINLYGGKIWVESEIGKGSTFIFIVPN